MKLEQEEANRIAYDVFRRSKADDIYASLALSEQAIIIDLARPMRIPAIADRDSDRSRTRFL
jgi:hypothetical protein